MLVTQFWYKYSDLREISDISHFEDNLLGFGEESLDR